MIKTPTPEFLFSAPPHFVLAKLLRFQRTFHEKSFGSGFGADAPTDNTHEKRGLHRVFYFAVNVLELRSKPCFKGLFCKKPLKNPQKLSPTNNNSNKNTIKDKIYIDFSENI